MSISSQARDLGLLIYFNDLNAAKRYELVDLENGTTVKTFENIGEMQNWFAERRHHETP